MVKGAHAAVHTPSFAIDSGYALVLRPRRGIFRHEKKLRQSIALSCDPLEQPARGKRRVLAAEAVILEQDGEGRRYFVVLAPKCVVGRDPVGPEKENC
jgi:hypothetical protein